MIFLETGGYVTVSSMTGFSYSKGQNEFCSWNWELKSVNSKGLNVRFHLPAGYENLEKNIRDHISKALKRGNISVNLIIRWFNHKEGYHLNSLRLEEILKFIPTIKSKFPEALPPTIDGLLSLRGVIDTIDEELSGDIQKELEKKLKKSFEISLSSLLEIRRNEGKVLKKFLKENLKEFSILIKDAEKLSSLQPKVITKRLKNNVQILLKDSPNLPEDRLAQEIALLVAKADIREELDRLMAHEQAAQNMIKEGGPIGRKLDFLCQEFNREVNTLCAKSVDIKLTQIGLEMKSSIEQFREQVQNIE